MAENKVNWNKSEQNILKEHEEYYQNMIAYIKDLRKEGPKDFPHPLPKKPISKLPIPSKSSKLLGKELHQYLKKKFLQIMMMHQKYLKKKL